ncbi:hypothetical protein [Embleya sp. NPDC005971]|uniref:hypothetical protein n=1 Tax=unclassified Embleya TaxID=2699296 RepID=UPI0034017C13
MTGADQERWLRDELAARVEELPASVAPIDRIEQRGRRARRRRTALIAASVVAVVAVSAMTAASLSGSHTRATGPAREAPASSTIPPHPETVTESPDRNVIATGEFGGHRWALARAPRGDAQAAIDAPGCDVVEVFLDGHLDNRGGRWCEPAQRVSPESSHAWNIASIAVGDTALYRPGVGSLGTITFGQVSAKVVAVTARFENDKAPITVRTVDRGLANGTRSFTVQVPSGAGYSAGGSLHFLDERGREVEAVLDIGLGAAK